jgi:6-pyruvoyltetrahydropterin/6-carboxytetrahydropterin synthase
MILTLKDQFSSAHFYHQPLWDEEKNKKTFGRCFTEFGHGHNYILEVGFRTEELAIENDKKNYVALLKKLTSVLDHEHLNLVIPEFKTTIPTTENIVLYFVEKLKQEIPERKISFVRVYEMNNLWAEIKL